MLLLALSLMSAAPVAAGVRLGATNLSTTNVPESRAAFYTDHLAQELTYAGVEVITQSQIAALVGQQRQAQLLGCAETQGSCLAELANALGSDGLILGQVARLGSRYQLDLHVVASDARELARFSGAADGEEGMVDLLRRAAHELTPQLYKSLGRVPPAALRETRPTLRQRAWVPAVAGGALLIAGGVFYGLAADDHNRIATTPYLDDAQRLASQGKTHQTLAAVGVGLGAVGAATAVAFYALGSSAVEVTVSVGPRSAGLVAGGRW